MVLGGNAEFKNERGEIETLYLDQRKVKVDEQKAHIARFENIPPNTNYSVKVSAVTRIRTVGMAASAHCTMPPTIPDKDKLTGFIWGKVEEQGRWLFKLSLPRISERNGPICCYR